MTQDPDWLYTLWLNEAGIEHDEDIKLAYLAGFRDSQVLIANAFMAEVTKDGDLQ